MRFSVELSRAEVSSSKMKILGKPAFIETENILHNQRIGKFVFFDKTINKTFLFYILQTRK